MQENLGIARWSRVERYLKRDLIVWVASVWLTEGTVVLREVFKPGGFNMGINQGRTAGAGIDGHIHTHVVPRWPGDTNFMTVNADVRVIPEALASTYSRLKGKFPTPTS